MIHATLGVPASGKTTWAEEYSISAKLPNINRDDLRNQTPRVGLTRSEFEKVVTEKQKELIYASIGHCIVSDTHCNVKTIHSLQKWAKELGVQITWHLFITPIDVCIQRNSLRVEDKVPEQVIWNMYDKFHECALEVMDAKTTHSVEQHL